MRANGRKEFRLFLIGTEFFRTTGGIQYVNRLLLRAFAEFARETPMRLDVFSYGDVKTPEGNWGAEECVQWHAFDRQRARLAASMSRHLMEARPHLALFTHVQLLRLAPMMTVLAPGARRAVLGHGVEVWGPLAADIRHAVKEADAVVVPSEFTRSRMVEVNGARAERTAVIPHGLDLDGPLPNEVPRATRAGRLILSVTRLNRADAYKGIDEMIRAMPRVVERCPEAEYVVAGDGNDRPRLEELARQQGLGERVRFVGELQKEELRRVYAAADVFALPSRKEGFGIVFLEAMYSGLPVVATRAGGTVDVVEHGKTGILVPPESPAQLASAVSGLLLLPDERARMGAAGRQRVEEQYLFPQFAARWQQWMARVAPEAIYLARHAKVFAGKVVEAHKV
jgi:glycosyltransferase involved in cell wall biosynthesis